MFFSPNKHTGIPAVLHCSGNSDQTKHFYDFIFLFIFLIFFIIIVLVVVEDSCYSTLPPLV